MSRRMKEMRGRATKERGKERKNGRKKEKMEERECEEIESIIICLSIIS